MKTIRVLLLQQSIHLNIRSASRLVPQPSNTAYIFLAGQSCAKMQGGDQNVIIMIIIARHVIERRNIYKEICL